MPSQKQTHLIALDLFSNSSRNLTSAISTVRALGKQAKAKTGIVTVVTPDDIGWAPRDTKNEPSHFAQASRERLNEEIKSQNLKFDLPPQPLLQTFRSQRQSARGVNDFTQKKKADLLIVVTHANKGSRFAPFGSFAEVVASSGPVPVLAVNAEANPVTKVRTILFATDFSDQNKKAFLKLLPIAKRLNAKVVLFHRFFEPIYAMNYAGATFVPSLPQIDAVFTKQESDIEKLGKKWVALAERRGVEVEFVKTTDDEDAASSILKWVSSAAGSAIDMIALTPRSDSFTAFVLGSTTRRILHDSKKPVLLVH